MEQVLGGFWRLPFTLLVCFLVDVGLGLASASSSPFTYHTAAALSTADTQPIRKGSCKRLEGLSEGQIRWCKSHYVFIQPIVDGAKLGLAECSRRFADRRWNCPTKQPSVFSKIFETANPEAAFVHGIESAGITLAIARTCSRGSALSHCGCDKTWTAKPATGWTWGSCSDNYDKGRLFAKEYLDASLNNTVPQSVVASYNYKTGREIVKSTMQLVCKCHGLTGTCAHKTCWYSLPKVQLVGEKMIDQYDKVIRVKWDSPRSNLVPFSALVSNLTAKLVYSQPSLDYCKVNATSGSLGTRGRTCTPGTTGPGSCNQLCCGRGYDERRRVETTKCQCKFVWCCKVQCQQCRKAIKLYTCR